jgi:multicomponent Na+:H+ antiporter subunit B
MFYKENIVISQLFKLGYLFIIIFAFYVQFHGKVSPGGGFQSGIVLAILLITYELLFSFIGKKPTKIITDNIFIYIAIIGVLCYALTGFLCVCFGGNIFDYSVLHKNIITGQQIGIFCIETGVGLTVFGSMMIIFRSLFNQIAKLYILFFCSLFIDS